MSEWRTATSELPLPQETTYRLFRCAGCGTAVLGDPDVAHDFEALYASGTYAPRAGRFERVLELGRTVGDLDRKRLARNLPRGGRVFEVGAGDGRLLALLANDGFHVAGIEPAAAYAALARAAGVAVETAALEATTLPAESQNAVVLWHVLEHLQDPSAALDRVRAWLAPEGKVLVAVPNLASVQAQIGGDRWFHQDVPRHVVHFTEEGIRALLTRTGFDVDRVRHVMLEQNFLGMWQTLLNGLTAERNVFFRFTKRSAFHARRRGRVRDVVVVALAGPLLVPIATALELAAGLAGRAGTVVVEATVRPDDAGPPSTVVTDRA